MKKGAVIMPREMNLKELNYSREEFLMEMARLTRVKVQKDDKGENGERTAVEVEDGRRFNTLMGILRKHYGYGRHDFQNRGGGVGSTYVLMPEFTEYLAILLANMEKKPTGKNKQTATAYVDFYNSIVEDVDSYLSIGFRNKLEATPGYLNASMITWWTEPLLEELARLFTMVTLLDNIGVGEIMEDITKYLNEYNTKLFEKYIGEKCDYEEHIKEIGTVLDRSLYEDKNERVLNRKVKDAVEKELMSTNISLDKILADLVFNGLYDYRKKEDDLFDDKNINKLEKAAEQLDEEEKYEIMTRAILKEEGVKWKWGDVTDSYSLRDVYRENYCQEYLSDEWLNENLYTEEEDALISDGDEEVGEDKIPVMRIKKGKTRITKQDKKRKDRNSWEFTEGYWREHTEQVDAEIRDKGENYLEFCKYIKKEKVYLEYKEAMNHLLGKVLCNL